MVRVNKLGAKRKKWQRLKKADWAEIEAMFVAGHTLATIKKKYHLAKVTTIYERAGKEGWIQRRDEFMKKLTERHLDSAISNSIKDAEKALEDLGLIRDKAITVIASDEVVPTKFSEASQSYINAVEAERKIRIEGVQLEFISEIASIIKDEVHDQSTLLRISTRFRELFHRFQKQSVPSQSALPAPSGDNSEA